MLARADGEQPIGIHGEGDADAGRTRAHGRYAAQLEAGQAAAVLHQVALALHHVQGQGCLAVFVGGEVLRHGRGNGLVARDDALDQPAHRFDAQREGDDVKQQQVLPAFGAVVAHELVGLHGRAQGHDFVGVEVGERLAAKQGGHGLAHLRHARGAADHDDALHVLRGQVRVGQRAAHGGQAAGGEIGGGGFKVAAAHGDFCLGMGGGELDGDAVCAREFFFHGAGGVQHLRLVGGAVQRQADRKSVV